MRNKKGGFSTQDFLISGLLFTAIVVFFVLANADIQNNYSSPEYSNIIDEDFAAHYDQLSEQTSKINTMRNTTVSGEGLSFRGAFDVTFGSFFTVMQLTVETLDLFGNMYTNLADDFPFVDRTVLNNFFIIGLAIITIIIIFLIINAVGRNRV